MPIIINKKTGGGTTANVNIASAEINSLGQLVLVLTDNTRINAGAILSTDMLSQIQNAIVPAKLSTGFAVDATDGTVTVDAIRCGTLSAWNQSNVVLEEGEMAVAVISNTANVDGFSALSSGAVGIKMGDGSHTFANLPWVSAPAGDVHDWAKAATKPTYEASEISGLENVISQQQPSVSNELVRQRTVRGDPATFQAMADVPIEKIKIEINPVLNSIPSADNTDNIQIWDAFSPYLHKRGKNLSYLRTFGLSTSIYNPLHLNNAYVGNGANCIYKPPVTISFTFVNASCQYPSSNFIRFYNDITGQAEYVTPQDIVRVSDGAPLTSIATPWNGRFSYTCRSSFRTVSIYFSSSANCQWSGSIQNLQMEYGAAATEFEEYSGTDIEIPLPINDFVGGYMTQDDDGTLLFTTNRYLVTLTNDNVYKVSNGRFKVTGIKAVNADSGLMSNKFHVAYTDYSDEDNVCYINSSGEICFNTEETITSVADLFEAYGDNIQIVYPGINLTYDMQYTYISGFSNLATSLGTNFFFSEGGPVEITYTLGGSVTKAEIMENIAPIENGTATRNYEEGELLIDGIDMRKATTQIASGEVLSSFNTEPTTVAAEYKAVLDAFNQLKSLFAPIETSWTATQDYIVGDVLIGPDGNLYKVTSAIATGETIEYETNCTLTTMGEEFKAMSAESGTY